MRKLDEALSRLGEVETQLSGFNRYTMMQEPLMPKFLATDVRKAREIIQELISTLDAALDGIEVRPGVEQDPTDIRERVQRIQAYVEG